MILFTTTSQWKQNLDVQIAVPGDVCQDVLEAPLQYCNATAATDVPSPNSFQGTRPTLIDFGRFVRVGSLPLIESRNRHISDNHPDTRIATGVHLERRIILTP